MKRLAAAAASLFAVLLTAGCEDAARLANENVLVFTIIQTPKFELPDGSTQAGITTASAFYGKRQGLQAGGAEAPPEGIPGATVTLKWSGKTASLSDKGEGAYLLENSPLLTQLTEGVEYNIEVINDANPPETFTGTVTAPPAVVIKEFEGTDAYCALDGTSDLVHFPKCRDHAKNTAFTITRANPTTGDALTDPNKNDLGFWAVYKIDQTTDPKKPKATNFPQQPAEFIQLIAADRPYREGTFTIPAATFSDAGSDLLYGVGLLVARKGTTSNNLFVGSVALAGHGSGGLLRVK